MNDTEEACSRRRCTILKVKPILSAASSYNVANVPLQRIHFSGLTAVPERRQTRSNSAEVSCVGSGTRVPRRPEQKSSHAARDSSEFCMSSMSSSRIGNVMSRSLSYIQTMFGLHHDWRANGDHCLFLADEGGEIAHCQLH